MSPKFPFFALRSASACGVSKKGKSRSMVSLEDMTFGASVNVSYQTSGWSRAARMSPGEAILVVWGNSSSYMRLLTRPAL